MRESVMHKVCNSGIRFLELFPFVTFSCSYNNSCSTHAIEMKLDICIDLDERKCHVQGS